MRGAYRRARLDLTVQTHAKGHAVIQVLNPDASVAQELSIDNLILNGGLDMVAVRSWVQNFEYCVLGSGSTPN